MSRTIIRGGAEWPAHLDELPTEQEVTRLFATGEPLSVPFARTVAIVGSRRPTLAGIDAAARFACGLAEIGFTIVSGLARGIDTVAHRACLDAGGRTIAVLGCGIERTYPAENLSLRRKIEKSGTVVSEYAEATPPLAHHFPARNRIIAGLACAVLFVEGTTRSGGRITCRIALDCNRSVLAVPGSIRNHLAAGPNELIRRSHAALVTELGDVLDELGYEVDLPSPREAVPPVELSPDERRVLQLLDDAPVDVETLARHAQLDASPLSLALSRLEIERLVRRVGPGYVITSSGASVRAGI